jgi:hypothetical protein
MNAYAYVSAIGYNGASWVHTQCLCLPRNRRQSHQQLVLLITRMYVLAAQLSMKHTPAKQQDFHAVEFLRALFMLLTSQVEVKN